MNNETKRDVFETFADECAGYEDELYKQYLRQYDNALPDDLPVIPKLWADTIEEYKANHYRLEKIFTDALILNYDEQELIARAWITGVWRVEETGEIVKLEA